MSNTYYGEFGGQFVSESLMNTLAELEKAFDEAIKDPKFIADYNYWQGNTALFCGASF